MFARAIVGYFPMIARANTGGMGSLLVVTGPPGAGKSTIARIIADSMSPAALVEGDEFFRFLRNGVIEPWKVEAREQNEVVVGIQATTAACYRVSGYETVYDGIVGPWFLDRFVEHAGAPVDYAVLLPAIDVCLHRIGTRTDHEFRDETATRSLHHQFVAESLDGRHVFDSGAGTAQDIAEAIMARRSAGRLGVG